MKKATKLYLILAGVLFCIFCFIVALNDPDRIDRPIDCTVLHKYQPGTNDEGDDVLLLKGAGSEFDLSVTRRTYDKAVVGQNLNFTLDNYDTENLSKNNWLIIVCTIIAIVGGIPMIIWFLAEIFD